MSEIDKAIEYWKEFKQEAIDMIKGQEDIDGCLKEQIPMCDLAIQALEEKKQREWVKCSERLPELKNGICSGKVLIAQGINDKQISFGWYRIKEWVTSDMIPFAKQELITHWMPLPQPYKEANYE